MCHVNVRKIKCLKCGEPVEEVCHIGKTGIVQQYAWCTCGWGGSYPFQTKNPYTGKYAWEQNGCDNISKEKEAP